MALRTVITAQNLSSLDGQVITFQSIDSVNGMQVKNTGSQVVLVNVPAGGAVTVTFPSQPDAYNRVGDKTKVCAPGVTAFGSFIPEVNWGDAAAQLFMDFTGSSGSPTVAVVTVI
jgi:hypothetical protein